MRYHAVNAAIMYNLVTLHMTMSEFSIGNNFAVPAELVVVVVTRCDAPMTSLFGDSI